MSEQLLNRINITTYAAGVGFKNSRGHGNIALQIEKEVGGEKYLQVLVGRSSTSKWNPHSLSSAWVKMNWAQAHEFVAALMHVLGMPNLCQGEGLQTTKHRMNLRFNLDFETDLCTMLNKKSALKEEILKAVAAKLDSVNIPEIQEVK